MFSKNLKSVCVDLFKSKTGNYLNKHCTRRLSRTGSVSKWKPSYFHGSGIRPLAYKTIGSSLQEAVETWPDKPWIVSCQEQKTLTYSEVLKEADSLAAGLLETGLQPGDKLAICCPNSIAWITMMMAASRAGLIMVGINPAYQPKELEFCLNKVGIKALVTPQSFKNQNYYDMMMKIAPELQSCSPGQLESSRIPSLKSFIITDDAKYNGAFSYNDILNIGKNRSSQNISSDQNTVNADSTFTILFTSGTTGTPKAATLSHFSYVNNSWEVGYRNELFQSNHKICLQVPLFHAFGLLTAIASLQHGTTMVIPSLTYNPNLAMNAIYKEKCTVLTGTPTMFIDLLTSKLKSNTEITTPQLAITGGAPCLSQLAQRIKKELGVRNIKSVYGMTESCVMFQSMPSDTTQMAVDTVGSLFGHTEAKVIDSEGKIVSMGTPGELCVRSYANMNGYYGDSLKTKEILSNDNWLRTGDQFVLHENGYGTISGRLKDVIIRGGENIFPQEIEEFLNTHPDIIEAYVFGVKDDRLGEEICASVRIREGSDFEYKKLKKFCEGTIAHFKIPRHLRIVEKFPITPSGKIQKFKLREMVESGAL